MRSFNGGLFIIDRAVLAVVLFFYLSWKVSSLGSMSRIAVSYGEKGSAFCVLKSEGSHLVTCYGLNHDVVNATPHDLPFLGLTGGSGFVCGLLVHSKRPFCWGSSGHVPMGVPLQMTWNSEYVEISAGDYQLCGLRKPLKGKSTESSLVDCWGYNMTKSYTFEGEILSMSSGSFFCCGLFAQNLSIFCWGDEIASNVTGLIPKELRFRKFAAGGYHVCGILEGVHSKVLCWGILDPEVELLVGFVKDTPPDPIVSVVGGKFHACGIKRHDKTVVCWGYIIGISTPPDGVKLHWIAAGDYFTCGELSVTSLLPVCWGDGFPSSLPLPADHKICKSTPCWHGYYQFNNASAPCRPEGSHLCSPCSNDCPNEMYQTAACSLTSDRLCQYNCSLCSSNECIANCSDAGNNSNDNDEKFRSLRLGIVMGEVSLIGFLVTVILLSAVLYIRHNLRNRRSMPKSKSSSGMAVDEVKIRRARMFTYEELDRATGGFKEERVVGRGSFSCVFKGVLMDSTTVAVKRAIVSRGFENWTGFNMELDLLSRLNHAHLLSLLGYCEEGSERLLVYEFMENGSLYQHLHGPNNELKEQLDWIKRVTIAVQAARGIEYLHGYASPPVIHRDIKSSNILIDAEHNAHVADFGLSLLGPSNGSSPLTELPAGTFGYLDPEYYRLHYLTTKSDVYSFGVLLLEILSGRKAVDMQYEEGNIVEWAVPLIRAGDMEAILYPVLKRPQDIEALKRVANVACRCVRMRGKDRPSMDQVTTALEQALAMLIGSPSNRQPILPTQVVLGSRRLHMEPCRRSGFQPALETVGTDTMDEIAEFGTLSWNTIPSLSSRRISSVSDLVLDANNLDTRSMGNGQVKLKR